MSAILQRASDEARIQTLTVMLERYGWDVSATARALAMDRSNLRRLLKKLGIRRPR